MTYFGNKLINLSWQHAYDINLVFIFPEVSRDRLVKSTLCNTIVNLLQSDNDGAHTDTILDMLINMSEWGKSFFDLSINFIELKSTLYLLIFLVQLFLPHLWALCFLVCVPVRLSIRLSHFRLKFLVEEVIDEVEVKTT